MFFLDNCGGLGNIIALVKNLLTTAIVLIAVVLIVLIIIDLAKSVIASEEKEVKNYQKAAIRRVIYFAIIFFVVTIVSLVMNLLNTYGDKEIKNGQINWKTCWDDPQGTAETDTADNG